MPNPAEVAQLQVGGAIFEDWETVWVQHRWADGWPLFRFTASERAEMPESWTSLQFKPGDSCQIILGGQLAITGIILTRQTAYDDSNHTVELSGAGKTWAAAKSSVDTKNANNDNMPLQAIASKVTAPFGVAVIPVGMVDTRPFQQAQAQPGELVFDFLDKLARQRGAILGSDHLGNFLLIGKHSTSPVQQLVEGENILKMQCIISNEMLSTEYSVLAQAANGNWTAARTAAEMEARVGGTINSYYKFFQTVMEQPAKDIGEVMTRATYEATFSEGTLIRAYVTVQGWLRDGASLWRAGDSVWVHSPMAMLDMAMKIQTATFAQDDRSGTTTVLEVVLPWMLADQPYGTGTQSEGPGVPQPPADATSTST